MKKYEIEKWFKFINYQCTEEELEKTLGFFQENRADVRRQIENLSWDASEEEQDYAIDYLTANLLPCEYVYLILADQHVLKEYNDQDQYYRYGTGKARWENAARTLIKIGWPKVDHILVPMFIWLLDPNWPGSELIYDFMLSLPRTVLRDKMKEVLNHPEQYESYDYRDLKDIFEELRLDANIDLNE